MGSLTILPHTQNCSGDKIEQNEMDGASSMCGGEERCIQEVGGEI